MNLNSFRYYLKKNMIHYFYIIYALASAKVSALQSDVSTFVSNSSKFTLASPLSSSGDINVVILFWSFHDIPNKSGSFCLSYGNIINIYMYTSFNEYIESVIVLSIASPEVSNCSKFRYNLWKFLFLISYVLILSIHWFHFLCFFFLFSHFKSKLQWVFSNFTTNII